MVALMVKFESSEFGKIVIGLTGYSRLVVSVRIVGIIAILEIVSFVLSVLISNDNGRGSIEVLFGRWYYLSVPLMMAFWCTIWFASRLKDKVVEIYYRRPIADSSFDAADVGQHAIESAVRRAIFLSW
jgi:uncharacterized membrane protein